MKTPDKLTVADIERHPVWEFANTGEDDTEVRPARRLPVSSLAGRLIGVRVMLANGTVRWAILGNIDLKDCRLTAQFLTLSIEHNGKWLPLARYHDWDYEARGPSALARSLGLLTDEVFPITYDLRSHVNPALDNIQGRIEKEPSEKLSREELIALAVR